MSTCTGDDSTVYIGTGDVKAPSFAFRSEDDTGIYLDTPGPSSEFAFTKKGRKRMWFDDDDNATIEGDLTVTGNIIGDVPVIGDLELPDGSASNPSLSFESSTTSGLYWDSSGPSVSVAGNKKMKFDTSLITTYVPVTTGTNLLTTDHISSTGTTSSLFNGPVTSNVAINADHFTGTGTASSFFTGPITSNQTITGELIQGPNFVGTGTTASTFTGPIGLPDSNPFPTGTTLYCTGDTTSGLSIDTSDQITNKTVFNLISSGSSVFQIGKGYGCSLRVPLFSQNINTGTSSLTTGPASCSSLNISGLTASQLTTTDSSKSLTSTLSLPVGVTGGKPPTVTTITGPATNSSTYTTPAGCSHLEVEFIGPGAGGGGCATAAASSGGGGGGGGGGYFKHFYSTPAATYTYVIGANGTGGVASGNGTSSGTSSWGAFTISAAVNGSGTTATTVPATAQGGANSSVAGSPDFSIAGNNGRPGVTLSATVGWGGEGGGMGIGSTSGTKTTSGTGTTAHAPGGGGGGGCVLNGSGSANGADGAPGKIIIHEFYVG